MANYHRKRDLFEQREILLPGETAKKVAEPDYDDGRFLPVTCYDDTKRTMESILTFEVSVETWLEAARPGAYHGENCYDKAYRDYCRYTGTEYSSTSHFLNRWEVALARLGFRVGYPMIRGKIYMVLVLPSSVDTALDRLAAMERAAHGLAR